MKNYRINIDWIVLFLLIFFSCDKEQPEPVPEIEVMVNGTTTDMTHGQIRLQSGDNILKAESDGAENYLYFTFGSWIDTHYEITESPLPGFQDTVEMRYNGANYYVRDTTGAFTMHLNESDGIRDGYFCGGLYNDFHGSVEVSGSFKNL